MNNTLASAKASHPFRVLTLDGGGMRGLYTAILLQTLTMRFHPERNELDIGKGFDLIVGTSTGGILACGLAAGVAIEDVISIYREHGPSIFPDPAPTWGTRWSDHFPFIWWGARNAGKPSADAIVLRNILEQIFDGETLQQVYERRGIGLCIPTVTMSCQAARVLKTPHILGKNRDNHHPLVDVCMATSAAPTVFPIALIDDPDDPDSHLGLVDGGLWANNPVLIGMIEAMEMAAPQRPIEILSIGTCAPPSGVTIATQEEAAWGLGKWKAGVGALSTALDAQSSGYNFMAQMLSKKFTECGRQCTVVRLPRTPPSAQQAEDLGLDRSDIKARRTLSELAKTDADIIHSGVMGFNKTDRALVEAIFSQLPRRVRNTSK